MIQTVDDLIRELETCKERYPEFGKYCVCIDVADDNEIYPKLKSPKLYVNTDIGQVEIYGDSE